MGSLQVRYCGLQACFYLTTCVACAFVTILLQYKGLANTQVGMVTAVAGVLNVVLAPTLSRMLAAHPEFKVSHLFNIAFPAMLVLFVAVVLLPLPEPVVMLFYIVVYAAVMIMAPLLSQVAIDYLRCGITVNFGLARGFGSASYALSAAVLGQAVSGWGPTVLVPVFVVSSVATLAFIRSLPPCDTGARGTVSAMTEPAEAPRKSVGVVGFIFKYRLLALVLVAFAFEFAASSCLSTYLVNIVTALGGDESLYGIGIFLMSVTELPAMASVLRLRRRVGTGTLFVVGGLAYVARNFLISLAPSLPVLFVGQLFQGLSYGVLFSLITYYVGEVCDEADGMLGQVLIAVLTSGIGSTLGNFTGGVLQDTLGLGSMFLFAMTMTAIGSTLFVAAGVAEMRRQGRTAAAAGCSD